MRRLDSAQREQFWRDGYVVVGDAIDGELLRRPRADFEQPILALPGRCV